MTKKQNNQNFMFHVSYKIGEEKIGAIKFNISLFGDAPTRKLSGPGRIFQPVSPPFELFSQLRGEYSYMCTQESCKILLVLDGFDTEGKLNVKLRIILEDNWKTGTASYEFLRDVKWELVENVPVKIANSQDVYEFIKTTDLLKSPVLS